METSVKFGDSEEFKAQLQDSAKFLIQKLQDNNFEDASNLIQTLYEVRESHVFNAVGKLTRGLHDAIVNFHVDARVENVLEEGNASEIRDASDRLQYVIKMSEAAADKTMDRVESAAPIAAKLREEAAQLRGDWEKFRRREMTKEEFAVLYERIGHFLEDMDESTGALNSNLQAIILEQGYQDLTGQVLKKVIGLVTHVEGELVHLVRIAGQVEEVTGLTPGEWHEPLDTKAAEGPQIHADKRTDVVSGQDDVDDLLSSLGF